MPVTLSDISGHGGTITVDGTKNPVQIRATYLDIEMRPDQPVSGQAQVYGFINWVIVVRLTFYRTSSTTYLKRSQNPLTPNVFAIDTALYAPYSIDVTWDAAPILNPAPIVPIGWKVDLITKPAGDTRTLTPKVTHIDSVQGIGVVRTSFQFLSNGSPAEIVQPGDYTVDIFKRSIP